jgi:hypothetical protein
MAGGIMRLHIDCVIEDYKNRIHFNYFKYINT